MTQCYRLLYSVLLIVICGTVAVSCRKKLPRCGNNCVPVTFSGRIYDKTNGTPFSNVPVSVVFFKNGFCPGSGCGISYDVASGVSKPDGSFSLAATIDTFFFRQYHLTVRVPLDSNYISSDGQIGSSNSPHFFDKSFYDITPGALQNIEFEFYPKAPLTIQLHRTQNDIWQYFAVSHTFKLGLPGLIFSDYVISGSQNARDSVKIVPTSADIYTKIIWTKKTAGIIIQENVDSIICTRNGPNRYDIFY